MSPLLLRSEGDSKVSLALFNFEDAIEKKDAYGGVAQLGEHLLCKQGVRSSILLISTYFS